MKTISFFIKIYLENRPAFFSLIRPQEGYFFNQNKKIIRSPILDFGCGDGFFAKTVFKKKFIDVGLDLRENKRINEAKKNQIYKKITLYNGKTIPYQNKFFQTVIANCVLEHIPDLDLTLKEIYRVLKPGGFFLTTVMTDDWEKNLLGKKIFGDFYLKFMRKKQEHHNLLSKNQWIKKFKQNGFYVLSYQYYLNKSQSQFLELFHYLSFPSLISYKLFNRWVIFKKWYLVFLLDKIVFQIINKEIFNKKQGSAIAFILKK